MKATKLLEVQLHRAQLDRRPLELHHHKPLAIKTSVPKFEDNFNPDKHYDPDRERADESKLKAEYKREKKAAVREIRKDANFMARENLREKKERDAAYEKRYKHLIAEIQGDEGHEGKQYEREKEWRKKGRKG
jgi:nucleolar protein 14